jgi:hypothetical protein
MVGQGDPPLAKTTEEIQREAEEEMARVAHLARELDKRKGYNNLQDDSGASRAQGWGSFKETPPEVQLTLSC